METISVRDACRRLRAHKATICKLIRAGTIPAPMPAVRRGWSADDWPAVVAAVDTHRLRVRAERMGNLDKARAAVAGAVSA